MTEVNIESGPAKVISSGSVISFSTQHIRPQPTILQLELLGLKLILEFEDKFDDNGKPEGDFERTIEVIDNKTIKFRFINYNSPAGIGTRIPLRIGTYQDKPLYMHYVVIGADTRNSKLFNYTFYQTEHDVLESEHQGDGYNA